MERKRDQPWLIFLQAEMQPPGRYSLNHYYGLWPERKGLHLVLQLRESMLSNNTRKAIFARSKQLHVLLEVNIVIIQQCTYDAFSKLYQQAFRSIE